MDIYKIILLTILVLSTPILAQNKEPLTIVTYKSYLNENFDKDKENSPLSFLNKIAAKNPINFKLIYNQTKSFYSLEEKMDTKSHENKMAKILMGGSTRSYTDVSKEIYLNQIESYGETFLIPIQPWHWELTNETKMIGNYLCGKATTTYIQDNPNKKFKKNVEAWYAPEINNTFGPKGFFGLPGLILELKDDRFKYVASHLNFNSKITEKIKKPSKGKDMSRKDFDDMPKGARDGN